jgi:hypothetical protein
MPAPSPNDFNSKILRSIVEHVFMPPQLPQKDPGEQIEQEINVALCDNLIEAAKDFLDYIPSKQSPLWIRMIKMMELAHSAARVPLGEANLQRTLSDIDIEGLSIYPVLFSTLGSIICYQMYLPCISAHRMLVSLCAGLPALTSFSLKFSRSRHRIAM